MSLLFLNRSPLFHFFLTNFVSLFDISNLFNNFNSINIRIFVDLLCLVLLRECVGKRGLVNICSVSPVLYLFILFIYIIISLPFSCSSSLILLSLLCRFALVTNSNLFLFINCSAFFFFPLFISFVMLDKHKLVCRHMSFVITACAVIFEYGSKYNGSR